MAENNLPHTEMGQLEITYRELLVKLKTHVVQLDSQTDLMLCFKWIQKLQTLTTPNDIKLRNYLLLQICNQIRSGCLDYPFINLRYLDQDLNCREWVCTTADDVLKLRSVSSISEIHSDLCVSDMDALSEVVNGFWEEPKKHFAMPLTLSQQNFYQRKYEEALDNLKKAKLKLYLKNTRSLEELVQRLAAGFIQKYQSATHELLAVEKSQNMRKEFVVFQLNLCSKFKLLCGDFLNPNVADNLLRAENQFQRIFIRVLHHFVDGCDHGKELVSTDRASVVSTDLDVNTGNNTKYSDYLKRYIRKQQKQFNRNAQHYESQISALKNEICLRDKKQSMQIIEMKCENLIRNEQKARDQLSESINELESKYKNIVQQIFNGLQEQT